MIDILIKAIGDGAQASQSDECPLKIIVRQDRFVVARYGINIQYDHID